MDQIEVKSVVPKFISFYEKASQRKLNDEELFDLWKEQYNFAAVPPTEEGERLKKKLLLKAWDKYEQYIDYIKSWVLDQQNVQSFLSKVKSLLGCNESINVVVIYFVGAFDENAFVAPYDEQRLALCLPIENGHSDITLCHELTHIVHSKTAKIQSDWERTVATLLIQEGLATHVSKVLVPGKDDRLYIEHKVGWLQTCQNKREDILRGIYPYLDESSSETIYRFTMGTGTTNTEREAYYTGWEIVGALLREGFTFGDMASIQETELPNWLRNVYPLESI